MGKNRIIRRKALFVAAASIIGASVIIPSESFASQSQSVISSTTEQSQYKTLNPWINGSVNDDERKKNVDLEEMNLKYDAEAIAVINQIQEGNKYAQRINSTKINPDQQIITKLSNSQTQAALASTKSQYRASFTTVALYLGTINLPFAGSAMLHSLDDDPDNVYYDVGSGRSNAWSLTSAYTEYSIKIAAAIDAANKNGKTAVSGTGSFATSAGNAGLDFYLALGKVTYIWGAFKNSSGKWDVSINTYDLYDFENVKVPNSFPDNIIAIANNQAKDAQDAGAIVPYVNYIYTQQNNYSAKS